MDRLWAIQQERRISGATAAICGFICKPSDHLVSTRTQFLVPATWNIEALLCLYPIEKFFTLLQIQAFVMKL